MIEKVDSYLKAKKMTRRALAEEIDMSESSLNAIFLRQPGSGFDRVLDWYQDQMGGSTPDFKRDMVLKELDDIKNQFDARIDDLKKYVCTM